MGMLHTARFFLVSLLVLSFRAPAAEPLAEMNQQCAVCHSDDGRMEKETLSDWAKATRLFEACLDRFSTPAEKVSGCFRRADGAVITGAELGFYRAALRDNELIALLTRGGLSPGELRSLQSAFMPKRGTESAFGSHANWQRIKAWLLLQ